jgi:hypothetical protein
VTFVALLAPALSAVVLGAHFLRAGRAAGVVASLALIVLLAIPRRWAARAVQAGLVLGAAEWIRTLLVLVAARREAHAPYTRLGVILAAVGAGTAASALVFESRRLRRRYEARGADRSELLR